MWRRTISAGVNPILARIARRMEWARIETARKDKHCAVLDSSVVLHPGAEISNLLGNPESISVGEHTHVRGQLLTFWNSGQIRIGRWCYVGADTRIWSQASVTIGDYVLIAHLVDVHDTNSHPVNWRERRLDTEMILSGEGYRTPTQTVSAPVVIEDDVWIGFKASILKGVHIGRGAIVAACSVVTQDIPAWSVVAGNPAKVLRSLTEEERRAD